MLNSLTLPSWIWLYKSSSDTLCDAWWLSVLILSFLISAIFLAVFSSLTTTNLSPAAGTSESPKTSTGIDGPADLIFLPISSNIALILPYVDPTKIESPTCKVPFWINNDATAPLPLSNLASITVPLDFLLGSAVNSCISAVKRIISSNESRFSPVFAETGTQIVSPPQSSDTKPCSVNSCLTLSTFAPGLSILFIATIIGTLAALQWLIASLVCGIIPSSAATTKITISVTCAPLALMAVKASCPGVSKNVIFSPFKVTV